MLRNSDIVNHNKWVYVIQSNSQLRIHVDKYLQLSRLPVPETATSLEGTYELRLLPPCN